MVEVTGSILVVGEQQYLLAFEFSCQQFFEPGELGIPVGRDGADFVPDGAQGFDITAQIVVQPFEVIKGSFEGGQRVDELARLAALVELIGERGWGGIVLLVLAAR